MILNNDTNNTNNNIIIDTKTEIFENIYNGGFLFSFLSLICCIFILFLIIFNKTMRTLTYNFLGFIFISEIINSIGNIFEYNKKEKISLFLIPFSDIFTMILFCYFSYCSIELIIKSNRNIKQKEKKYLLFSFIGSLIYTLILYLILILNDHKNERFYFYNIFDNFKIIRFIHIGFLVCLTAYFSYNILTLIKFLKEKKKNDKINSWKIAILIKILFRFHLICLLYWIFYIPSIIFGYSELKIVYIFKLFSMLFFRLRGFLIFLNTLKTKKIQIILQRIIEIYIRHFLLGLDIFNIKRRKSTFKKQKKLFNEDDENDNV